MAQFNQSLLASTDDDLTRSTGEPPLDVKARAINRLSPHVVAAGRDLQLNAIGWLAGGIWRPQQWTTTPSTTEQTAPDCLLRHWLAEGTVPLTEALPWVRQMYDLEPSDEEQVMTALEQLVSELHELLVHRDKVVLNRLLGEVEVPRLINEIRVGLLRMTFSSREHLSAWAPARDRIQEAIRSENEEDLQAIMVGLL